MGEEDGRGSPQVPPFLCVPQIPVKPSTVRDRLGYSVGAGVSDGRIAPLEVQGGVSRHCIDLPGDHEMGKEPRKLHLDL